MSRQLKKYEVKIGKHTVMNLPHILIIGHSPEKKAIQLNIQGKISFEEMIDMFTNAEHELLVSFYKEASRQKGIDTKKLKQDIYDRAVLGFSMMIDKFLPEAKDDKYAGMTNEAVMEAQNTLLKKKIKQKQDVS